MLAELFRCANPCAARASDGPLTQPLKTMISSRFLSAVVAPRFVAASSLAARHPVDMPLPMVGTGGHGHAFPGAAVPFGMVQLSPDTPLEGWDGKT